MLAERFLAGGGSYADAGSVPSGARVGSLGSATSIAELTGDSDPAVLVGGTDGFLYALDACTLELRWSLDLRYPVAEPILADIDGDGFEEIVVSVADGFLYGVDVANYPAPGPVLDLDPEVLGAVDVDEVDSADRLAARWEPIDGATSYEIAVLTAGGTSITDPPYRDVGAVTETVIDGLSLELERRYAVVVRAIGSEGSGAEAVSDGVVIRDLAGPRLTVQVTPAAVMLGERANLTVTALDPRGVDSVRAEVFDSDGASVQVLGSVMGGGDTSTTLMTEIRTGGASGLPVGEYVIRATALDVSGHESTADAPFAVTPMMMADGGPGPMPPPDDTGGDCSCRASGRAAGGGAWWSALVGAALLIGRRRRHSRRATRRREA